MKAIRIETGAVLLTLLVSLPAHSGPNDYLDPSDPLVQDAFSNPSFSQRVANLRATELASEAAALANSQGQADRIVAAAKKATGDLSGWGEVFSTLDDEAAAIDRYLKDLGATKTQSKSLLLSKQTALAKLNPLVDGILKRLGMDPSSTDVAGELKVQFFKRVDTMLLMQGQQSRNIVINGEEFERTAKAGGKDEEAAVSFLRDLLAQQANKYRIIADHFQKYQVMAQRTRSASIVNRDLSRSLNQLRGQLVRIIGGNPKSIVTQDELVAIRRAARLGEFGSDSAKVGQFVESQKLVGGVEGGEIIEDILKAVAKDAR